jgi:predicted nuclease of predicted toxin-antitoxin system
LPKILADENIHKQLVLSLRLAGIDVLWLAERDKRGIKDSEITKLANKESRVLLTSDSDFINDQALTRVINTQLIYVKNKVTKENAARISEEVQAILKASDKIFIIDPDSLLGFDRPVEF